MVTRGLLPHDIVSGVGIRGQSRYDELVQVPTERELQALLTPPIGWQTRKISRYKRHGVATGQCSIWPPTPACVRKSTLRSLGKNVTRKGGQVDRALERGGNKISHENPLPVAGSSTSAPTSLTWSITKSAHMQPTALWIWLFPTSSGKWVGIEKIGLDAVSVQPASKLSLIVSTTEHGRIVERPKLSPYDLRHFYASMLIEQRKCSLKPPIPDGTQRHSDHPKCLRPPDRKRLRVISNGERDSYRRWP